VRVVVIARKEERTEVRKYAGMRREQRDVTVRGVNIRFRVPINHIEAVLARALDTRGRQAAAQQRC